jgi:hypothetical protein
MPSYPSEKGSNWIFPELNQTESNPYGKSSDHTNQAIFS